MTDHQKPKHFIIRRLAVAAAIAVGVLGSTAAVDAATGSHLIKYLSIVIDGKEYPASTIGEDGMEVETKDGTISIRLNENAAQADPSEDGQSSDSEDPSTMTDRPRSSETK